MNPASRSTNTEGTVIFTRQDPSVPFLIHSSELASLALKGEMEPFGGNYAAKLAPCACNSYLLLRVSTVNKFLVGAWACWEKRPGQPCL